jgi:hypothetical protein
MGIAAEQKWKQDPVFHMACQIFFVDASSEHGGDRYIKALGIHMVDQIDEHFFCTALAQIMDQKKELFHKKYPFDTADECSSSVPLSVGYTGT